MFVCPTLATVRWSADLRAVLCVRFAREARLRPSFAHRRRRSPSNVENSRATPLKRKRPAMQDLD